MSEYNRRKFLKRGCQAISTAGLALGANPMLTLARAAETDFAASSDYRALVCIFLQGGSDGFSLFVPTASGEYQDYANSRKALAVDRSNLLDLSTQSGPQIGVHSAAAPLQSLFNDGKLSMLSNVGNLIEPTTIQQYKDKTVSLPAQLFSHSDQEIQWQQLQGQLSSRNGWGALASSYLQGQQQRDYLTSVSLSGSNYWQSSETLRPLSIQSEGVIDYAGMGDLSSDWQAPRREIFTQLLRQKHSHVLTSAYTDLQQRAYSITTDLGDALTAAPNFIASKPLENELADQLEMVAQLISLRETLGMTRQIFFVRMKGWDVHDSQSRDLPGLFTQLAESMQFFQTTMEEIGLAESVMAFTASDFGRTLSGNGDGTDHGWGNHHMIMGGGVAGSEIYGSIPRMSLDGPDSVRNGRVVPAWSATQYSATLLRWLGLSDEMLDQVLPDLVNFEQRDLGFVV